jgi:addiction module RelE/StbE family toxin
MDIIWTNPAKKDLRKIFNYFKKKVSLNLAQKIVNSILANTSILKTQNIGIKEQLLTHLEQEHRFIIDGNYKIIYIIQDNTAYITHVFDTRQNPTKLK